MPLTRGEEENMSGLTIISLKPCDYCKGEGKVAEKDKIKKRIVLRTCPVCHGNPAGAATIQGDIVRLLTWGTPKPATPKAPKAAPK